MATTTTDAPQAAAAAGETVAAPKPSGVAAWTARLSARPDEFERGTSGHVARRRRPEIAVLALLLFAFYAYAGWWLRYDFHFTIGDALSRSEDAKLVLFSRDPHLAAVGVYWMPLPTYAQLPFMAVTAHIAYHADFAGPLSTAMFGGLTALVLGKLGRDLGLSRLVTLLLLLCYSLNPVIVYFSANGMAESAEFFFLAMSLWGLLRWFRDEETSSAVVAGAGLAGLALSKYEAAPVVLGLCLLIVIRHIARVRSRRYVLGVDLALVTLPAFATYVVYLIYNKVILGSFLAFRNVNPGAAQATAATPATPAAQTPVVATSVPKVHYPRGSIEAASGSVDGTVQFLLHNVAAFSPGLVILIALLALPPWRRTLGALAILGAAAGSVVLTTYLAYGAGTYGEPRYYTPLVVVTAVAAFAVIARVRGWRQLVVAAPVAAALLAGWVTAPHYEQGQSTPEQEAHVYQLMQGKYDDRYTNGFGSRNLFEQAARNVDAILKPGDRIILDNRNTGSVDLLSTKSNQFINNADEDYESITAPDGGDVKLQYALITPPDAAQFIGQDSDFIFQLLQRQQGQWTMVWGNDAAQIWKRDPAVNARLPKPALG